MNKINLTAKRSRNTLSIALALSVFGTASTAQQTLPAADWSGPYAGFTLGLTQSNAAAKLGDYSGGLITLDVDNGLFPEKIDGRRRAGLGGMGVGYNLQWGSFVGGVEADFSLLNHTQTHFFSRVDPNPDEMFNGLDTNTTYTTEFKNLMTLRVRGGYAQGQNLFFATAGLAAGDVRNDFSLALPGLAPAPYSSPDWSERGMRYGTVVGVGLERRLTERMSLKAEILRFDLQDVTIQARDPDVFPGEEIDYKFSNSGTLARIGLNFSF